MLVIEIAGGVLLAALVLALAPIIAVAGIFAGMLLLPLAGGLLIYLGEPWSVFIGAATIVSWAFFVFRKD